MLKLFLTNDKGPVRLAVASVSDQRPRLKHVRLAVASSATCRSDQSLAFGDIKFWSLNFSALAIKILRSKILKD